MFELTNCLIIFERSNDHEINYLKGNCNPMPKTVLNVV